MTPGTVKFIVELEASAPGLGFDWLEMIGYETVQDEDIEIEKALQENGQWLTQKELL